MHLICILHRFPHLLPRPPHHCPPKKVAQSGPDSRPATDADSPLLRICVVRHGSGPCQAAQSPRRNLWLRSRMWCVPADAKCSVILLLIWALVYRPSSGDPSPGPPLKGSYNFGKTFLGLDKCNACIGTSICKKFFKDEIRFENWLSPRLKLPSDYLQSYPGNYTDDSESWRQVEIARLMSKHQHDLSDKRICASISKTKSCSIEQVLMKTERFQKWSKSKRLTPDLVQGLPIPLLSCPSQRLLDRIVRRYAEVQDAGSAYMDHFTDRDKMRLLYTLSINAHPILLQIFPGGEGWPFSKYLGSCGRLIVSASTVPLKEFYSATAEVAADLGYQLLRIIDTMRTNDMDYLFYFTHIGKDTFGTFSDGHLFIKDASSLGVIDRQQGYPKSSHQHYQKDIFSCLTANCHSSLPPCDSVSETQSLVMVCKDILPHLLMEKFLPSTQQRINQTLKICMDSALPDQDTIQAGQALMELLKTLRTCDPRFAYRYPDCKYSDRY
ncbi:divergent protein kinase domain 2B isoform X1 [Ambystoma mexicanum]|uniref:divergent protein kinase domain 2B isoform X1 n=1 Tax=Ambystoma mexicanum TaxID=8296 RepID=UPI0037E9AC94